MEKAHPQYVINVLDARDDIFKDHMHKENHLIYQRPLFSLCTSFPSS